MQVRSASAPSSASDSHPPRLVAVWDPFIRISHWTVAVLFFVAYGTEDDLMQVHVWAGYLIGVLLLLRFVWGLVGPRQVRFTDFVYRPATVVAYLRDLLRFQARRYIGHSPAGGAMVIALLLGLVVVVVSGVLLYGVHDGAGPLAQLQGFGGRTFRRSLEGVHEFLANLLLALVIAHVVGVLLASFVHHENLVRAMITGRKRAEVQD
jgi:cytochrome b